MSKSASYWDKRALRRLADTERTGDAYIKRIRKMYDKSYKDLNEEIEIIYKNYSKSTGIDVDTLKTLLTKKETSKVWRDLKAKGYTKYIKKNYKTRITNLEKLKAQIYAKAKDVYTEEEMLHHDCYKEVVNNSYYKSIYDTQKGIGYEFGFNKLDNNLVNSILSERWSGKNYSQRIWGNTDILAESVSEIVGAGLLGGVSVQKMAKQIRDRYSVNKYYAERLVRTECNHFNNEADAMAYEDMDVDKYVFVATLDSRTSEICQEHDNKVYNLKDREEGVNFPPLHPNCRSTTRGYLGEEAEAILTRRARNPKTGKTEVIGNINYKEWAVKNGLVKDVKPVQPKPVAKPKATRRSSVKPKGGNPILNGLKNSFEKGYINFNPVKTLSNKLDTDKIIEKLAGGDKTKGSCMSLALAYAGNRAGLDVTDYRGGYSQEFFSRNMNIRSLLENSKVKYFTEVNTNDFKAISSLLDNTLKDKEYILITGRHASVIRNSSTNGWEYLELQSAKENGYKKLDNEVLRYRFGCKRSHSSYGMKISTNNWLVSVEEIKKAEGFKEMLGYINTSTESQVKGAGGYAK